MRSVPRIRIFLSSPGDVADERRAARLVIERLRTDPLLRGQVDLDPIDWSDPDSATPMLATMTPQEAINRGLAKPSESDIVIVIFWARMGTPLPPEYLKPTGERYLSGTEWEYEDAVNASKIAGTGLPLVVIYRREGAPALQLDDPQFAQKLEQWQRVQTFFAPFTNPDGSLQQGYNRHTSIDDFTRQLETHLKNLIKQVIAIYERRELPPPPVEADAAPLWQGSPFPGLRAFTPADEPIYFGRGGETDALVERLRAGRLIAVVGASGSGKSSLVGAGLLSRLSANTIEGSKDWLLPSVTARGETRQWQGLRFTPSEINDNPFDALAAKLAPLSGRIPRTIAAELSADPARLLPLIDEALAIRPAWAEALLFIDQFEELFTLCARHHRAPFIALLATAASSTRVRIVLTLRADFYANAVEDAALAGLLEAGTFPLSTPGQAALYGMITRPAAQAGLEFEGGLAERILDDTGDDPGALALLAYALDQLYRQSAGKTQFTLKDYQAVGGVQGAIGDRAEAAFGRLAAGAQATFAIVFRDLVEVDERGEPTRRRAALNALTSDADARALIERLTDERLLVTNRTEVGAVVEVAHEALLRSWDRLRLWIAEQTSNLQLRRRLEGEARAWAAAGAARQSDFVLLGSRLEEAERWMSAFPAPPEVRALIIASITHRAAQIAAEERRKVELEQATARAERQRRRALTAIGFAVVIIVVAVIVGIFAAGQVTNASTVLAGIESQRLAARSEIILAQPSGNVELAALLGIRAVRSAQTEQGHTALQAATNRLSSSGALTGHAGSVIGMMELSDGRLLSWSRDATLRLWGTDGSPESVLAGHTDPVTGALELGDGRLLSWSADHTLRLWGADWTPESVLAGHTDPVTGALELHDGRLLSWSADSFSSDATLRLWGNDGAPESALAGYTESVRGALELRDGQLLSWSYDGTLRLWGADGAPESVLAGHTDAVRGALELRDGRLLSWSGDPISGDGDNTLRLWGADGAPESVLVGHTNRVNGALELGDGRLLSWSADGTLRLWSVDGTPESVLSGHTESVSSALELGDGRLLSWSYDRTLRLWGADGAPETVLAGHTNFVNGALELGDGRLLSWSADDTLWLWGADGTPESVLAGHSSEVYGALELRDGRLLSWSWDDTPRLWGAVGASAPVLAGHTSAVYGALELSNGRLLSWSGDNNLRLWGSDGAPETVLAGHTSLVNGALELSDGRLLSWAGSIGSNDNTLRLWDADGTPGSVLNGHTERVDGALELSDGRLLSWSYDGTLRLWGADGAPRSVLAGHSANVDGALELSDGRLLSWSGNLYSDGGDNTLRLWGADGAPESVLAGHSTNVDGALELSDGRLLSWSLDGTLRLWGADGAPLTVLDGYTNSVWGALELSNGRLLSWSADSTLRLWGADGAPLTVLDGHTDYVFGALELGDGHLLSWSRDNTLRLWSAGGTPESVLNGHTERVDGALELSDGRLLSWSLDGTLRLWGADGAPEAVLDGHTGYVDGALELSDGRLLSWSADDTLRLWQPTAGRLAEYACTRVFRDLTAEERAEFGVDDTPTCPRFAATPLPTFTPYPTLSPQPTLSPPTAYPTFTPYLSDYPTFIPTPSMSAP